MPEPRPYPATRRRGQAAARRLTDAPLARRRVTGGRDRDQIIRHVNGAEIDEYAPKVGVKVPLETRGDAEALRTYRDAFVEAIRQHHARGEPARSWALQFLIRRCAWHMLDHAWELEDRDLTNAPA